MKVNNEPAVKVLMCHKLWMLQHLAREYGLSDKGTKLYLAVAIAEAQSKQFEKNWVAISTPIERW